MKDNIEDYVETFSFIREKHTDFFESKYGPGLSSNYDLYYDFALFADFVLEEYIKTGNKEKMALSAETIEHLLKKKGEVGNACILQILQGIGGKGQDIGSNIRLFFSFLSPEARHWVTIYYKHSALVKLGLA